MNYGSSSISAIFVAVLIYLLKKPLSDAFKAKREAIRAELIKAEEEKQAALAQLTAAEAKLAALEAEKAAVLKKANDEADAEKRRLLEQTETEITKLKEQTTGEIRGLPSRRGPSFEGFQPKKAFGLAEEKLRAQIDASKGRRSW